MKFNCTVTVNQPIEKVVELFSDPQYLGEYQDGFVKKELISGEEGQVGAVSKMYYEQGKRKLELTETIVRSNLPREFFANYHHEHMDNTMKVTFTKLGRNETRYDTEIDYVAFRGFLPKMMALLFPGVFKKQVQKWLDNFKAFAEGQV